MKKYLLILLATMAFVACNDDPNDDYFEQLTLDELLTTGAGVDYLVRTSAPINPDEIVNAIKDKVLSENDNDYFILDDGKWDNPPLYGGGSSSYLIWDDYTVYNCFFAIYSYSREHRKIEHDGDAYKAIMRDFAKDAAVVAFVDHVVIVQYHDDYGRLTRKICYIRDSRDAIIEEYLSDIQ